MSLEEILALPHGERRHHRLQEIVAADPSNALAHVHLGISYRLNCADPILDLPLSVLVFGPARAPREVILDRLGKAEEHLKLAKKLDRGLKAEVKGQLRAVAFHRDPRG